MNPEPLPFLRACAAEPWTLCRSDCLGVVVRWLVLCGHERAAGLLPDIEPTDEAVGAWLAAAGGLETVMHRGAETLGLARAEAPATGAVGHLDFGAGAETAAIWLGRGWGFRTRCGLGVVRAGRARERVWGL
jgi:hypothetical protein